MPKLTVKEVGPPGRMVQSMMADRKYMDEEGRAIAVLKKQSPGNADVLAREERFFAFKAGLEKKFDSLPKAHINMLCKALVKQGYLDRSRQKHGVAFDQKHAQALASIGVNVDEGQGPAV